MKSFPLLTIERSFTSCDGARRYLLRLDDGKHIESVLIPRHDRTTLCISSQVGCGLGCAFCLTGRLGFTRDLSASEIISQVLLMLKDSGPRFSVVFMGMGEPLQNYANTLATVRFIHDNHGLRLPMSRITISTAGLVPEIERLSREPFFPNLSISLTGATNSTRDVLMPINRKYPIETLVETIRRLPLPRQKRVMFECVMIKGMTDSMDHAEKLATLLQGTRVKVNLIPLNPAPEIPFARPGEDVILRFQEILIRRGTATFIRKNRGNDVSSACGQLMNKVLAGSQL